MVDDVEFRDASYLAQFLRLAVDIHAARVQAESSVSEAEVPVDQGENVYRYEDDPFSKLPTRTKGK